VRLPITEIRRLIDAGLRRHASQNPLDHAAGSVHLQHLGADVVLGGTGAVATDPIWDAKGDLAAGTGANTASKLTVGANDTVLTADSAMATGLKWAAGGGGAHAVLSATHSDTLAGTVAEDDIIVGNATPKWSRLAVAAQTLVGRITGGHVVGLTPAQIMALLSGSATAAFGMNAQKITGLAAAAATGDAMRFDETPKLAGDLEGTVAAPTVKAASLTVAGKVELATAAEINTGTDTTRAMPIDQFVASNRNIKYLFIRSLGNAENHTVLATVGGDFESPIGGTIVEIGAYVDTAGVTGLATIDVHKNGTTLMTTNKITIDSAEKTSRTAATAPALTTTTLAAGDIITVDIDGIQTTAAKGLTVRLGVRLT
jgi:hypothetical protein